MRARRRPLGRRRAGFLAGVAHLRGWVVRSRARDEAPFGRQGGEPLDAKGRHRTPSGVAASQHGAMVRTPHAGARVDVSGPPRTALTSIRSVRPATGSAPNSTPPTRALIIGWTSTAMGALSPSGCRAESSTVRTAPRNSSHPRTSSTESNRPAREDPSLSSCGEDDRTTRGRAPCRDSSSQARNSAEASPGRASLCASRGQCGITKPGSTGSPARAARARLAALEPESGGSEAVGWFRADDVRNGGGVAPGRSPAARTLSVFSVTFVERRHRAPSRTGRQQGGREGGGPTPDDGTKDGGGSPPDRGSPRRQR